MAKKDFSNLTESRAFSQIQEAQGVEEIIENDEKDLTQENTPKARKPRKRYTEEEAQKILESGRNTSGLGGVRSPRINLKFSPQNYDFILTLARMRGETLTAFVNHLLDKSREEYSEYYNMAKKMKNSF